MKAVEYPAVLFYNVLNLITPVKKIRNKRVLIYCDMGIGNFVLFMHVINSLVENGYCVTLINGTKPINDIIDVNFSACSKIVNGYYTYCIVPFCSMKKKYIKDIIKYKIPIKIGQGFKDNKWKGIFNIHISFNNDNYEITQNLKILECFRINPVMKKLSLKQTSYNFNLKNKCVYQTISMTTKGKTSSMLPPDGSFIIGSKDEINLYPTNRIYKFICCDNILESFYLIKDCKRLICLESGIAHIAINLGIPTVVFYNSSITPQRVYHKGIKYIKLRFMSENEQNIN